MNAAQPHSSADYWFYLCGLSDLCGKKCSAQWLSRLSKMEEPALRELKAKLKEKSEKSEKRLCSTTIQTIGVAVQNGAREKSGDRSQNGKPGKNIQYPTRNIQCPSGTARKTGDRSQESEWGGKTGKRAEKLLHRAVQNVLL